MPRHEKANQQWFPKHHETPPPPPPPQPPPPPPRPIVCRRMRNNARGILFLTYPPSLPNTLTPQDRLLFISPK